MFSPVDMFVFFAMDVDWMSAVLSSNPKKSEIYINLKFYM